MASLSGVSSGNYISSLYNSANRISGLASGLDTEGMIESLTQSYQTKITQLQQKQTKLTWKQDAYRSIISKMYAFSNKYTSYTSSSNLMSQAFWNSARTSSAQGAYAGKVSASGTTSSDVVLNSVDQLATSARYVTKGNFSTTGDGSTITASEGIDLTGDMDISSLRGSLSLVYGTKSVNINFSESDIIQPEIGETNAEALARVINEKLGDQTIALSSSSVAASDRIVATANSDGSISFSENPDNKAGNNVYISGSTGNLAKALNLPDLSNPKEDQPKSFRIEGGNEIDGSFFKEKANNFEKISGKTLNINLDGTTKQVVMPKVYRNADGSFQVGEDGKPRKASELDKLNEDFVSELNKAVQQEFGKKIEVSNADSTNQSLKLQFSVDEGSDLLINSDAGNALKIGNVSSNYLNTSKTLGDLGLDFSGLRTNADGKYDFEVNGKVIGSYDKNTTLATVLNDINSKSDVKASYSKTSREFVFTSKDTGEHTKVDFGPGLASAMFRQGGGVDMTAKLNETLDVSSVKGKTFSMEIDGQDVSFQFSGNSPSIKNTMDKLNATIKSELGINYEASLSDDGSLVVKKFGMEIDYSFGSTDEVGEKMINALREKQSVANSEGYTAGKDAKFTVTVNGTEKTMTRSSNSAEIDGLTINFKGTFNKGYNTASAAEKENMEGVTFQSGINSDKVVEEVKNMLAEYNVMLSEVRGQYATMPVTSSSGSIKEYEPLTDEDMADMTESAIQKYEEKAKQGLLFADSNLSGLYQSMVGIFNLTGADRTMMDKMGIGISYDTNGAATITMDESKFREALESDYEGVVDLFTRSKENGASSDGIMQGIKTQMDRYGSTTGAVKGILVQQAGTPLASLSLLDNGWQKEIDNYTEQIEKWADKLESQVDHYTQMFTRLETLINQMNSQSSSLSSLMGG